MGERVAVVAKMRFDIVKAADMSPGAGIHDIEWRWGSIRVFIFGFLDDSVAPKVISIGTVPVTELRKRDVVVFLVGERIAAVAACTAKSAAFGGGEEQGGALLGVVADRVFIALNIGIPWRVHVDPLRLVCCDRLLNTVAGNERKAILVSERGSKHLVPVFAFFFAHVVVILRIILHLNVFCTSKARSDVFTDLRP